MSHQMQTRLTVVRQYVPDATIPLHCSLKIWGRFCSKISVAETGCWEWTAYRNRYGYGNFGIGSKIWLSHRFAYFACHGSIPKGLDLDHLCRNPACCNPVHLEAVSHRENILRGIGPVPENAKRMYCERGHEFTPQNTYIQRNGWRHCRACRNMKRRENRAKKGGS